MLSAHFEMYHADDTKLAIKHRFSLFEEIKILVQYLTIHF